MKKIIILIVIVIIIIAGYFIYQSISSPEETGEAEIIVCEVDADCIVFGQDGDCNCGCFNKNHDWEAEGDCFCAAPKSCKCVDGKCEGVFEKDETADWQTYTNEKYGYSLKYPADCFYGPLPGYCKQSPPEERSQECLCFFNGEYIYGVSFQSLTAENDNWRMASFSILHPDSDFYNPPAGSDLIGWLKEKDSWEDIPDEINMELDGIPAVRVYTPPSQGAGSQESIYFILNDKLINFNMLEVDNEYNREFYNQILSTFSILE